MKRTIAIVAGGDSSELVVSLRSAQGLYSFIDKERYNLYIVEMEGHRWEVILPDGTKTPIDRNDFGFMENGEKKLFDFAYITIHGTPGENGILQGYFDLLGIPYSSCNVLVSAMTFNKFTCNQYLKGFGIRVAESLILRKGFEITDEEVEAATYARGSQDMPDRDVVADLKAATDMLDRGVTGIDFVKALYKGGFEDVAESIFNIQKAKVVGDYLHTASMLDDKFHVISAVNSPNCYEGPMTGYQISPELWEKISDIRTAVDPAKL